MKEKRNKYVFRLLFLPLLVSINPENEGNLGILFISDCAVVTSGNYERYFTGEDGKVYGHIINPATGYPAENGLLSVTIIAQEGKLCDALSTSLFVMGCDKATEYWRESQSCGMLVLFCCKNSDRIV